MNPVELTKPLEAKIELTENCNEDCFYCFNKKSETRNKELSKKTVVEIIKKVADGGIEKIRFTGGEPLLRNDLDELCKIAKDSGLYVMLNTNGSLLDDKKINSLSKVVDNFLISLAAFDKKTDFRFTKTDFFDLRISNIKKLVELNNYVRCSTILINENIPVLEKGKELIENLNVNEWVLLRPIPNKINSNPISSGEIGKAVEKLFEFREQGNDYLIENALPFCCHTPEKVEKVAVGGFNDDGRSTLAVNSGGTIKPSYFSNENLGKISETNFNSAWSSIFMKRLRANEFIAPECRECRFLKKCMSGSRFSAKFVNGNYFALDPLAEPEKFLSH